MADSRDQDPKGFIEFTDGYPTEHTVRDGNENPIRVVREGPVADLEAWLRNVFTTELPGTLDKAELYGAADLQVMADAMGVMIPSIAGDNGLKLQAAVAFYTLGKVARVIGALRDGRSPSEDTWYDTHIYGLMGLKVYQTGCWLEQKD